MHSATGPLQLGGCECHVKGPVLTPKDTDRQTEREREGKMGGERRRLERETGKTEYDKVRAGDIQRVRSRW